MKRSRLIKLSYIFISLSLLTCSIPEVDDVDAPIVSLVYPYNLSVVNGMITVSVVATDNREVNSVWYHLDGRFMEKAVGPSQEFDLDVSPYADEQVHVFQAFADDVAGNRGASVQALVTISATGDVTPPTIDLIAPTTGQQIEGAVKAIARAVDDRAVTEVAFFVDGDSVFADVQYPYEFLWSMSGYEITSNHTLFARARDAAGNIADSAPVTITVTGDVTPPVVDIIAPTADQQIAGSVNAVARAVDDRGISMVSFFVDGDSVFSDLEYPYEYLWSMDGYDSFSSHSIFARAYDTSDNLTDSAPITITALPPGDFEPPSMVLLYPLAGDTLTATVTVALDISDNVAVERVEYYVDGGVSGMPNFTAQSFPWNYTWDTSAWADNRSHTLYIKAFDTSGNLSTLGPLTYIIE